MAKLVVGPINKGLRSDVLPFNIDNDNFPKLVNAYQWRGRVKRKRGTSKLNRLTRAINSSSLKTNGAGNFSGNIISTLGLEANSSIVLDSITIGADAFTDTVPPTGVLTGSTGGSGTINYATGALTITGAPINTNIRLRYYPGLPVMGLEDLVLTINQFAGTLAFDTTYSYNIDTSSPYNIYDVSFYKNPAASADLPSYTPKTSWTSVTWNGQDYQQFWTVNYQGALWATNGINVPFSTSNIGMQYQEIDVGGITRTSATTVNFTITGSPLVVGDFVFVNETVSATTGAAATLNFLTGYVTAAAGAVFTVTFPGANITAAVYTGGILQYLTTRSDVTKDCIRWYDGDPTDGNATLPTLQQGKGWVNFMPPLSQSNFSISDLPAAQYYLVGARMIVPFKDRLLFIGPVVQTSAAGSQVYLQDTIIYSQNGTPYYTATFAADPTFATTTFDSILVPANQTATAPAYFEDVVGFGGFIQAGVDQAIITASSNEDALILGFENLQARLVYSGNDIVPFNFYSINSELGSGSTFSVINMDEGVLSRGTRGFIISSQTVVKRIDLDIPDEAFQINLKDNGSERFCAQRDYVNEWVYFTFRDEDVDYVFPSKTLLYNYRDNSWGIFKENYTTYGLFRRTTGLTWSTAGDTYGTWNRWNDPWDSGSSNLLQPDVIAGNQQGFVVFRDDSTTNETDSLSIQGFSSSTVTSPDHCLNNGDYIVINNCSGTISSEVNGKVFSVFNATTDTFDLNPSIGTGTYLGNGTIQRMYVPFIQTKQFPPAWELSRKTRIGPQQYLLTTTQNSQIQLLIFLSQNGSSPYNEGGIVPSSNTVNNSLIYSTILYTCPESTNLGLTPANINLQMVTAQAQSQIWHRKNTSLLGDTIQLGFTMSDSQMRDADLTNQFAEIELHGIIIEVSPSMVLA
jgi:hypothetical protein